VEYGGTAARSGAAKTEECVMPAYPESHRDLLDADVAMLATGSKSGYPQVTAIWFLYENGEIKLSLNTARQKVKNLLQDPKCTFFILDRAKPQRYLEVRANAKVTPDDDYTFANTLAAKYGGTDLRTRDKPGETRVVVTLEPVKVFAR
jgi:PPOX class probable F420-dependent enzyme